ncbi:MAG TPA: hypothetical protein DCS67_07800 [Clostridiales bacterium UBA8960]|jgi:hypothetical protein|nr:hypothetical protein [Clostridiales bacterium UBA8960]
MSEADKLFEKWSGDVHPKIFKNIRNRIQITEVKRYSVGYLRIETLTETRSVYPILKQMGHQITSNSTEAIDFDLINPWIYDAHFTEDQTEVTKVIEIPNTERVVKCQHCHGQGHLSCDTCASKGFTNCLNCFGTGKSMCTHCNGSGIEVCTHCSGKGIIRTERMREWYTEDGSKHQKTVLDDIACPDCLGKGHVPCGSCEMGSIPCHHCEGQGRTICDDCQGQGMVLCEGCNGKKTRISTLNVKLKRITSTEILVLETPDFIRKFNAFNIKPTESIWSSGQAKSLYEKGPLSQMALTDLLSGDFINQYDFMKRSKTLLGVCQTLRNNERIIKQIASFVVVDFLEISYHFEGETYAVFVNTLTEEFYVDLNPFQSILDGVFEKAVSAFEKHDYDRAEQMAEQSRSIYSGTEKESATSKLLTQIKKAKNRQVLLGMILALQFFIVLKFIALANVIERLAYVFFPVLVVAIATLAIERFKPYIPIKKPGLRFLFGGLFITILIILIQLIL